MKYYVDAAGRYLGAWDDQDEEGSVEGAIEVPTAPDSLDQVWDGEQWVNVPPHSMRYYVDEAGAFLGGWDAEPPEGAVEVPSAPFDARQSWLGDRWGDVPAEPITTAAVDAERNRRISAGFQFGGHRFQSRLPDGTNPGDWEVFSGKALEALIAVMGGAVAGDLRWSDPDEDFAWIAADNSRVPMDAQTVIELGKAASAHRTRCTFAGSDLKAKSPIPADYSDDKWWP